MESERSRIHDSFTYQATVRSGGHDDQLATSKFIQAGVGDSSTQPYCWKIDVSNKPTTASGYYYDGHEEVGPHLTRHIIEKAVTLNFRTVVIIVLHSVPVAHEVISSNRFLHRLQFWARKPRIPFFFPEMSDFYMTNFDHQYFPPLFIN